VYAPVSKLKTKIKKEMQRQKLAEYLEGLAAQLRAGKLEADGRRWSVPDKLQAKISHKEEKGRIDAKIKWHWSTLEEYEDPAREQVIAWQDSWKALKKRLTLSFKAIEKTVVEGKMPGDDALALFISRSREMVKFAEPEWQAAIDEYIDHLGTLKHAVREGQFEVVQHEMRDLRNRMMQCHRDFK
jgi:XXXCH domain-containing protein